MATSIRFSQVWRFVLLIAIASILYGIFSESNEENPRKSQPFRRPKFSRKPTQNSAMASQYLKNIASRRSIYALSKESTISNARIQEILIETIKHSPTAFNSQSSRAVLLLSTDHEKLWDIADNSVLTKLGEGAHQGLKPRIDGFKNGYGTILWFEDGEVLKALKEKNAGYPFEQWSEHAAGILQIHTWDALELEGLGANLQHFNFLPGLQDEVKKQWNLPEAWDLKAQLVFGKPTAQPGPKTFDQVEGKRLLVFGE